MEKTKSLKETIDTFVECVSSVDKITNSKDLSEIERKAVRALQLAEIQIAEAGDDLYKAVLAQRRLINSGRIVVEEKPVKKVEEPVVEKPKKKTTRKKKTAKKAE